MALNKLKESVFNAISIDEVIWIDDRFDSGSASIDDTYIDTIKAAREAEPEKLESFEAFSEIEWEVPIEQLIESDAFPKEADLIHEFLRYMEIEESDYTEDEFQEIEAVLTELSNSNVTRKFSGAEWNARKAEFETTDKCYLILVDINFEKEQLPKDHGKTLIREILQKECYKNSYCVLFTSETQVGSQEEAERKSIVESLDGLHTHNFSVLSKMIANNETPQGICVAFKTVDFIRRIFLRKLSVDILDSLTKQLIDNLQDMRSDLGKYSIYELNNTVFDKSLDEGSSEIELFNRFISIQHHQTMYDSLSRDEKIIKNLVNFRGVQSVKLGSEHEKYIDSLYSSSSEFHSLRLKEIFDSTINTFHSPLSVGDIFSFPTTDDKGQSVNKEYMLISQPCDLIVRGGGDRNKPYVTLVEFERVTKSKNSLQKDQGKPFHYFTRYPNEEGGSKYLQFDFRKSFIVNSNLLDMCVFSKQGELSFSSEEEMSDLIYLPGWIKRYNSFKEALFNSESGYVKTDLPNDYSTFTLIPNAYMRATFTDKKIEISGSRIERLRSPFVDEVMKKYFVQYLNRFAFEKDFTE
ncbi:hypothetical protein [Vibrio atypicus]|uniref:hypothetical protein n=1 Tax=Vibrio atypicus TaxID=558271 RepID=UPI00135C83E8|nr:hypothetical protein [Vibrio atypicus]